MQLYWAIQTAAGDALRPGNERGVTVRFDELQGGFEYEIRVRFLPDVGRRRWWWPW